MPDAASEILIIGITESGSTFRPSDWAERLCGVMSLFGEDQRISYSPFVRPTLSAGVRCVIVDARLEQLQPEAFEFLLGFARDNELRVKSGKEREPAPGEGPTAAAAPGGTTGPGAATGVVPTRSPPVTG
jgi:hypothetical protein